MLITRRSTAAQSGQTDPDSNATSTTTNLLCNLTASYSSSPKEFSSLSLDHSPPTHHYQRWTSCLQSLGHGHTHTYIHTHTHRHTPPHCPSSSPSCGSRSPLIVRGQASELGLLDFVAQTVVAWAWEGVDVRGAELLSGEHSLPGPCGAKCPPQLG